MRALLRVPPAVLGEGAEPMASKAEDLKREAPATVRAETPRARRGRRIETPPLADIPSSERTPQVESTVMRLMRELDRLKDELLAAHERVRRLESIADEDPLVPVLNRRGFLRELERALAYAKRYGGPVSLVFLDIDRFKDVNDRHGHAAGDAVLRHVAELLLDNVRKSDIVGRLGGDEFALVLHRAGAGQAAHKAEQLMALAAASIPYEGRLVPVGLSAGVAELAGDDTAASALARADAAMYERKQQRRAAAIPSPEE